MKLNIKRNVTIKAIVTPRLKEEMMAQLQGFLSQADRQLEQLEFQGKRAIAEIERTNIKPLGPEAKNQIENIRTQVNEQKNQLLQQKPVSPATVAGDRLGTRPGSRSRPGRELLDIQAGDNLVEK